MDQFACKIIEANTVNTFKNGLDRLFCFKNILFDVCIDFQDPCSK